MTTLAVFGFLVSGHAMAQKNYGPGWQQPGQGGPPHRRGDGFSELGDNIFVESPRVCDVTHVKIIVTGDNIQVNDLRVLYGNGVLDDVEVRERFQENSQSHYKKLRLFQRGQGRCIEGFTIDATGDRDSDAAFVTMYALQGIQNGHYAEIKLGSAYIKDLRRRRDEHRRGRGQWPPGRPGRPGRP